jgi:hypothetical protein
MNKKEKTNILRTYQDVIATIKQSVITDLVTAMSSEKLNVPPEEYERLTSLLGSLIDLYGANGYELFQRTIKER